MAIITSTAANSPSSPSNNGQSYRGPFTIMTVLFFMWGFITVLNDILIPRLQDAFTLTNYQIMFVQTAFFGAYFIGSLLYFAISATAGDPIARIGYKNGVVIGLLLAAIGGGMFWPAATLAPQSTIISPRDFHDFPSFVQKLTKQSDPVSIFIFQNLSESTRADLNQGIANNLKELEAATAQDLNTIIRGPMIYDAQRFSGIKLEEPTKELLSQNPQGESIARLNRALLEDAYAGEIMKYLTPFWIFLGALFVVGLGFAMLQIAANPYVTILGPERTASSRLNLAQAFNSLGTTTGPLIGGYLIYEYFSKTGASGAESVKIPYLFFSIIFAVIAVIFFFLHLPHVGEGKIDAGIGALKYPHVVLGVLAIFMYVGGEVSVGSQIIKYLGQPDVAAMSAIDASKYVSLFWGGMLIGRFMGAVELSEMKKANKQLLLVGIPLVAFLILLSWRGWDVVKMYLPMLALCWLFFQFGKGIAGRALGLFSATIVVLLAVTVLFGGRLAMWCIVGIGLFTSIGWPNIFSLALDRMGILKSQVSSLLVMAVVGGAVLPPIMGKIADHWNRQYAFIVPLLAYAYVAFYGWKGHKIGRQIQAPAS